MHTTSVTLVCTVDKWRVVLKGENPDYINATNINVSLCCNIPLHIRINMCIWHWWWTWYMQGYKQHRAFIITQGPMQSTSRDFWKMVCSRKCSVIVMLSDLVEQGDVRIQLLLRIAMQFTNDFVLFRKYATSTGQDKHHKAMGSIELSWWVKRLQMDMCWEHSAFNNPRYIMVLYYCW